MGLSPQDVDSLGWGADVSSAGAKASSRALRRSAGGSFAVVWQLGNMPRVPLSWEDWGAPAYSKCAHHAYDSGEWERKRLERERVAAEEAAARAAELSSLRRARDDATEKATASAAAATEAKATSAAKLAKMQAAYDARIADMEANARAAALLPAPAGGAASSDASLCIVCLDAERQVALQPCGHYNFCKACAAEVMRLGKGRCPVCRNPVSVAQEIFL